MKMGFRVNILLQNSSQWRKYKTITSQLLQAEIAFGPMDVASVSVKLQDELGQVQVKTVSCCLHVV